MERTSISSMMTGLGKGLSITKTNIIDGLSYVCKDMVVELMTIELIMIGLI